MTSISNFQTRFRFTNPDGTLTPEASRMLRDWFARIGGTETIDLAEVVAILTAIQVEIIAIQNDADALNIEVDGIGVRVDAEELEPMPADKTADIDFVSSYAMQTPPSNDADIMALRAEILQAPLQSIVSAVEYLQTEVRSIAEQLAAARNEIQELKQGTML